MSEQEYAREQVHDFIHAAIAIALENGCEDTAQAFRDMLPENQLAALQQEIARLREENAVLKHERSLIEADVQSGRTDCSTPLFQMVRNVKESAESSLLAVREALEAVKKDVFETGRVSGRTQRLAENALSTTSAQAEGIKARWQADTDRLDWFEKNGMSAYKYGCENPWMIDYKGFGYRGHDHYASRMSASFREAIDDARRAAQLTAKTGEGK